jgi:protein PET117
MLTYFKAMHEGVIRDVEQQRVRRERQLDFDMQKALEKEYRKVQDVIDDKGEITPSRNG